MMRFGYRKHIKISRAIRSNRFKIVEKKFQNGENAELKNLKNNMEINNSLKGISKNIDNVSHSQEKISKSQTQLVTLIELTYKKINGDK